MLPIIECLCETAGILAQTKVTLKVTPEWGVPSNELICSLSCSTQSFFISLLPTSSLILVIIPETLRSTKLLALCLWYSTWNTFPQHPRWVFFRVQFSSVAQLCPTLCDPMNRRMPGLPVHHHPPEFTQTHVHQVGDAIQPSHPLSSPSPPAPNPSQHQSLFQWVNSLHEVAKVLEFQL